jgi:ribonuclease P protein component
LSALVATVSACGRQQPAAGKFWQRVVPVVATSCLRKSDQAVFVVRPMRARSQFLAANAGVRAHSPAFVLIVHPRKDDDDTMGMGITVTKKIGNAVVRNRIKRRFRALSRAILPAKGLAGADHVLIGKIAAKDQPFAALQTDFEHALIKAQAKILRINSTAQPA